MDGLLNGIVGAFWALLGIGFVVAGLGIINTLSMNVMEQTRDIGLLRIVGMTRSQVKKFILIQATLISGVGIGLGCLSGVVTAYIMQRCSEPILGYSVDFVLHPGLLFGCCGVGVLIGVLAAYSPAKRAVGLQLNDALTYE
ncbi:MAG: FtsX-like permease family protein [Pirellulales bacterium]